MPEIVRIEPPFEVVTPDGKGWAIFIRDPGWCVDDAWTVVLAEGPKAGQAWTYLNPAIRFPTNFTFGVGDARK
jgi:hypothetical protein